MWFFHLILLLVLYTFGPGMLLVRPLRLARAERLVVAVAVGLFLDYLLSFSIFALSLPHSAHIATTIVAAVLGVVAWRDWLTVLRCHQVRRMLWCWLCLLAWGFLLLSMIRHFGGGTWGGDWREHYERTRFFQGGVPLDFKFIDQYPLPMRPPLMNAIVGGMLVQVIDYSQPQGYGDFEAVQLAFVFLNSLVVLPCVLVIGRLVKLSPRLARRVPWTLAAVLAASPMFSQNLSYAWTKQFAAFYAILAIVIYLRAWRRRRMAPFRGTPGEGGGGGSSRLRLGQPGASLQSGPLPNPPPEYRGRERCPRFVLAFALLCAGFLVHYSVGPYALFLGLHYLFAIWWRRPAKWTEAAAIGGTSAAVLVLAWFAWSISVYGIGTTFTSTSAVSDSAKMTPAQNVANIAKNLGNTLLPTIVRKPGLIREYAQSSSETAAIPATAPATNPTSAGAASSPPPNAPLNDDELSLLDLEQPSAPGRVRDFFFLIYQVSLPGGLGSIGWAIALWLLLRVWSGRAASDPGPRRFWIAFIPTTFVVGIVVYGGQDRFGVAHVCLQPLLLLGLGFLAGGIWTLGPRVRGVLLVGLLLDFTVGIFLHMELQHRVDWFRVHDGRVEWTEGVLSRAAQYNLVEKDRFGFAFWGDRFPDAVPLQAVTGGLLAFLLFKGLLAPRGRRAVARPQNGPPAERSRRGAKPARGGRSGR